MLNFCAGLITGIALVFAVSIGAAIYIAHKSDLRAKRYFDIIIYEQDKQATCKKCDKCR